MIGKVIFSAVHLKASLYNMLVGTQYYLALTAEKEKMLMPIPGNQHKRVFRLVYDKYHLALMSEKEKVPMPVSWAQNTMGILVGIWTHLAPIIEGGIEGKRCQYPCPAYQAGEIFWS